MENVSMSSSEGLGDISRWIAKNFLGEQQDRSVSKIIADGVADGILEITGSRPSRDTVEDWVHVAMLAGVAYIAVAEESSNSRA